MQTKLTRKEALALLKQYNKEPFHIRHAITIEGVMHWYANELGFGEDADFWAMVGLLHDIDFELYPEEHCQRAPELLRGGGAEEELIHAVCSPRLWHLLRREARAPDGKGALCLGRADRFDRRGRADAPVQKRIRTWRLKAS